MGKRKLDLTILPRPSSVTQDETPQTTSQHFTWNFETWEQLVAQLTWLEKAAYDKAQHWDNVKAPPANVDPAQAEAWASLAEFYIRHTGNWPTGSPRMSKKSNRGRVSGEYGEFLETYMATIPGEKRLKGGEVRGFLRSRYFGERMEKFLDAHHGLLREPPRKKPLKRS